MGLLDGKKALVTGVANKRSIAWGIATALQREGADLAFNYAIDRLKENVDELVATLPGHEKIDATFSELEKRWGSLDILIHCIAFAPLEELKGSFTSVSRNGMLSAIDISAYSLIALTRGALPLFEKAGGGAVMSLTFNAAERVVPSYNAMAIAKAALEAETRYLAAELGAKNVRVNTISAGPLKTLAASAVKGISAARELWEAKAPLRRNVTQDEIGNVAVFLASDWSRSITGATIFADNGMNIMGTME